MEWFFPLVLGVKWCKKPLLSNSLFKQNRKCEKHWTNIISFELLLYKKCQKVVNLYILVELFFPLVLGVKRCKKPLLSNSLFKQYRNCEKHWTRPSIPNVTTTIQSSRICCSYSFHFDFLWNHPLWPPLKDQSSGNFHCCCITIVNQATATTITWHSKDIRL